jgi:hypothetical protein
MMVVRVKDKRGGNVFECHSNHSNHAPTVSLLSLAVRSSHPKLVRAGTHGKLMGEW